MLAFQKQAVPLKIVNSPDDKFVVIGGPIGCHNDNLWCYQWRQSSHHIDGLVQERRNSIANALELRLSCTNPSILHMYI